MGETLLANFVPWLVADYLTNWKDITRISPRTWRDNLTTGPVWDDNHWHINGLMHPYQGHYYYLAGRSNGYTFEKSFLFTVLGSAIWECCGESHSASPSDLVTTTLGGTVMGEVFFRLGSHLLAKDRRAWEWVAGFMTPSRALTRWLLGQRSAPPGLAPQWALPEELDGHVSLGLARQPNYIGYLEVGVGYNRFDALTTGDRPFSHYVAYSEWGIGGRVVIGRAQARGTLGTWYDRETPNTKFVVTPTQGLDYINRYTFHFGGPNLGVAAALRWKTLLASADVHGLFAGVGSKYAEMAEYHDAREEQERNREYDFGVGFGGGLSVMADPWSWLRISGMAQYNRLWTLHGSNVEGYASRHQVGLYGVSLASPQLLGRVGVGGDVRFYRTRGSYDNPAFDPVELRRVTEWRFYLSYHLSGKPLAMFVF